uniref:Ovochymase 1 n=1 Tax=Pan paniscus TaxID=9597 RepID=A0A2R8ZVZ5_PANPA
MGMLASAGLLLLLVIGHPRSLGLKCGIRMVNMKSKEPAVGSRFFSRISSWRNSTVTGHPWQVSLKSDEHHFCGGSLIQEDRVVTAAHCLDSLSEKQLKNITVTSGDYSLFQKDKQEQNIPVSKIITHPEYNSCEYMSPDIALLYLKHKVKFGNAVQPICLPDSDDKVEPGILCLSSGWGKISKTSEYSNVLQEMELPIMDDRACNTVLKSMNLPPLGRTMLCAGFPDGGMDACQGDSGGPLVCRRGGGIWILAGITSWVAGCAGGSAPVRNNHVKASLGIFSKVSELMDFITQNLFTGLDRGQPLSKVGSRCITKALSSVQEVNGSQRGEGILDMEKQVGCDHDYVSLRSSSGVLFNQRSLMEDDGKQNKRVCGKILPSPLLAETCEAMVPFVSDTEDSGSGFELTFTAVQKSEAGSGCGSLAILVEEGTNHSAKYPDLYSSNIRCHWFICAPEKHIIKLTFEDFAVKFSPNCIYDAVVIYGDSEEKHKLAKLCGMLTITSIFSSSNMTVIYFKSDGKNRLQGFKARFTILPSESLNKFEPKLPPQNNPVSTVKAILHDVCGIPPFSPQWLSRRIAGGEEACPHCWPWQVGLRFLGDYQCGGAIINPVWILTAAHCVQLKNNPLSWTIIAGDHDRNLKESTEQVRRAKHIIVHEDFNTLSYDSDIALIQLSSPLEYNSAVRPVCLPHSTEPLFSSEICAVTGWGSISADGGLASRLQQIQVHVLEREVCEHTYYSAHPGGITEKMICAGFAASGEKDFCQGDSGGPLVCRHENGPFVLYGIVSWGAGCVQPWKPGVFARVMIFLDWIQSKINGPASLQTNNKCKTLKQQLPPPTPSPDSASWPGCCSEAELEKPRGFFPTPRYLLDYRGRLECSWVLRVSPSSMAKFTIEYLSLLGSPVCQDSVLIIYEERHSKRKTAGGLHGRRLYSMTFMSPGPLVRVTFHALVRGAFGISYIVLKVLGPKDSKITRLSQSSNREHLVPCEDVLLTKPEGIMQIPRNSHRTTMGCQWRLVAPLNHIIQLNIINFPMKPTTFVCHGHLRVYEGFGPGKKLIASFAGTLAMILTKDILKREKLNFINTYIMHIWENSVYDNVRSVGKRKLRRNFMEAEKSRIQVPADLVPAKGSLSGS